MKFKSTWNDVPSIEVEVGIATLGRYSISRAEHVDVSLRLAKVKKIVAALQKMIEEFEKQKHYNYISLSLNDLSRPSRISQEVATLSISPMRLK